MGMRRLVRAYCGWEIRNRSAVMSVEDAKALAKENLDFIAQAADAVKATRNLAVALLVVAENAARPGEVTMFYRNAVGYNPIPDKPG